MRLLDRGHDDAQNIAECRTWTDEEPLCEGPGFLSRVFEASSWTFPVAMILNFCWMTSFAARVYLVSIRSNRLTRLPSGVDSADGTSGRQSRSAVGGLRRDFLAAAVRYYSWVLLGYLRLVADSRPRTAQTRRQAFTKKYSRGCLQRYILVCRIDPV